MFKVGDKVKLNDGTQYEIIKLPGCSSSYPDHYQGIDSEGYKGLFAETEIIVATELKSTSVKTGGVKYDSAKPPMDLIPYEALEEIAKVLAAGEQKYGTANWTSGIEMRRLLSAAMRHIGQFNSGEDLDEETQTLHIANAATNLMFAIWMYKNRPDLDNRWAKKKVEAGPVYDPEIMAAIQRRGR